jgi:hypothetical protein
MMGTSLEENSNCLATAGEELSPASACCSFGALGDFLVECFFEGIVPAIKMDFKNVYRAVLGCELISSSLKHHKWIHTCNSF